MRKLAIGLCLLVGVISGCQSSVKDATSETKLNYLTQATAIPITVAQAFVVQDKLSQGLRLFAQAAISTYTLTSVDFYGQPLAHVTLTAPRPIDDLWQFASSLTGDEWAGQGDETPWTVTVTGATDARPLVSMEERGLGSLLDFYETLKALGGPSKFKQLVGASTVTFLLEDTSGKLWDTQTHAVADPTMLQAARQQYDEMAAANADSSVQDTLKSAWAPLLERDNIQRVQKATLADGNLNVQAFTHTLSPQYQNPSQNGWTLRSTMLKLNGKEFKLSPSGFDQFPSDFSHNYGDWRYFICPPAIDRRSFPATALGCAPAALVGLLDFQFQYRGHRILNLNFDPKRPDDSRKGLRYNLTKPVGNDKLPLISTYMGTCWFGDGYLTRAKQFHEGIARFLGEYAPTLHERNQASNSINNQRNAPAKVELLKWAMFRNSASSGWPKSRNSDVPVLAQSFTSLGRAHFSAVLEWRYKVLNRGKLGQYQVLEVRTQNYPDLWLGITDTTNYEVGVYAIN